MGTAGGAQLRCATCYTAKPPSLPHICCAEVTLVCKTLPCSRLKPSQAASPCSILCPLKTEPCAKDGRQGGTQALQSAAPADLLNFGPGSTQRDGISSACCKQLQGGGGETSTARLCSSQQADGSLSVPQNRAPRHEGRPKSIHFSESWALETRALCTTVV